MSPGAFTSIDAGNTFDPDGTWTTQSLISLNITESVTGGVLDGGTIAGNTSRGIGTPWVKTPFQDLVFGFTLENNATGFGTVQYTGTALTRSDLNGDGALNQADWALFTPNSFTAFAGDTAVAAYRKGDLDGDKDNDIRDFRFFKQDYIAANGGAAFAALTGVPEPAACSLALVSAAVLLAVRRRRSA